MSDRLRFAALVILLLTSTASAQPTAAASPEEARRLFEEGVALLREQRYAESVATLQASLAMREMPAVHHNLGIAYRGMGRYRLAIAAFERFVAMAGDHPRHTQTLAEVAPIVTELRAALVHLRIEVQGGATAVQLDDETIASADGTLEIVTDPGRHRLDASRPGHRPVRREIETAPGATVTLTLDVSEAPLPGQLTIECSPATASIELDGEVVGEGRIEGEAAVGEHVVWVRAPGYVAQRRTIEVRPGAVERLTVSLPRVRAEPESVGITGRWWFWAGAATVVAGAVIAAVLLVPPGREPLEEGSLGFTVAVLR